MKKKTLVILILIFAIAIMVTACRKPTEEKKGLFLEYKVDGEIVAEVNYKGNLELPQGPQKEGYTFEGWFMEEGFVTPLTSGILDTKQDGSTISVYACFKPIKRVGITILFTVDGNVYKSLVYKGSLALPEEPQKAGYDFKGWYLDQAFSTPLTKESLDLLEDDSTVNVYSKFTEKEKVGITINFIVDNNVYHTATYKGEYILPENPKKEGFTFNCWIISSEQPLSKEYLDSLDDGATVTVSASFTLKPQKKVTFIFNVIGEEYTRGEYSEISSLPIPSSQKNTIFMGWYLDQDFKKILSDGEFNSFADGSEVDLYARFVDVNAKNITLQYISDGEVYRTDLYNGIINYIPDPSKSGYKFVGWYFDEQFTLSLSKEKLDECEVNSTVKVYANFKVLEGTTVKFMVDGNEYHTLVYDGLTYALPDNPIKRGLTFDNWYIDQAFTTPYTFDYMVAQEDGSKITVYAKFVDRLGLKLTFYLFGEQVDSYLYTDSLTLPRSPYKFGYRFNGWCFEYNGVPYYVTEENLYKLPDGQEVTVNADMERISREFAEDSIYLTLAVDGSFSLYYESKGIGSASISGTYTEVGTNVTLTFENGKSESVVINETDETMTYNQSLIDYCVSKISTVGPPVADGYEGNYKQYRTDNGFRSIMQVYLDGNGNSTITLDVYGSRGFNVNASYTIVKSESTTSITFTLQGESNKVFVSELKGSEITFTDEIFNYYVQTYEIEEPVIDPPPPKEERKELDFILPSAFTYTGSISNGEDRITFTASYDGTVAKGTVSIGEIGAPDITYVDSQKKYCYSNGGWYVDELGNEDFFDLISDMYILALYNELISDNIGYAEQSPTEEGDSYLKFSYTNGDNQVELIVDKTSHIILSGTIISEELGTITIQGNITYTSESITIPQVS